MGSETEPEPLPEDLPEPLHVHPTTDGNDLETASFGIEVGLENQSRSLPVCAAVTDCGPRTNVH